MSWSTLLKGVGRHVSTKDRLITPDEIDDSPAEYVWTCSPLNTHVLSTALCSRTRAHVSPTNMASWVRDKCPSHSSSELYTAIVGCGTATAGLQVGRSRGSALTIVSATAVCSLLTVFTATADSKKPWSTVWLLGTDFRGSDAATADSDSVVEHALWGERLLAIGSCMAARPLQG